MKTRPVQIIKVTDPAAYFDTHAAQIRELGVHAFGANPLSFVPIWEAHFRDAAYGQIIVDGRRKVGVVLYDELDRGLLWLQGIGIDPEYQGQGIGVRAVEEAFSGFRSLVATTRNPAVVKLVGKVTDVVCPALHLPNPLHHLHEAQIQRALKKFAPHVKADPATLPFIHERYPADLYATDPGRDMPFSLIQQNPRSALMVAGFKL